MQAINTTNHAQAKHYRVAQGYVREMCDIDEVRLVQTPTADNQADFFTKAVDHGPFEKHRHTIMGPHRNPSLPPISAKNTKMCQTGTHVTKSERQPMYSWGVFPDML